MLPRLRYVQSWDIETTGHRLPYGPDVAFAVGTATLELDLDSGAVREVESERWVLSLGSPTTAEDWRARWMLCGWDMVCWDEFWSCHVDTLNAMMALPNCVYQSEKAIADSIAAHIALTESRYPTLQRVYDTIGFDITNLDVLLTRNGHTTLHLWHATGRPAKASYMNDISRAALRFDPFERSYTPEQRALIDTHNAAALPPGLAHTHDPADDARCIAYKWVHFAKLLRSQN